MVCPADAPSKSRKGGAKGKEKAAAAAGADGDEEMADADAITGAPKLAPAAAAARWRVGARAASLRHDDCPLSSPLAQDGTVADWDALEAVWDHALRERLCCDASAHPLMCSEPTVSDSKTREKMAELAFEQFNVPAFFLGKSAVLAGFATGRATGLVVDVGHNGASVTPVHDGYALQRCALRTAMGGEALSAAILAHLESKSVVVRPRYAFKKVENAAGEYDVSDVDVSKVHASFARYKQLEIMHDLKESVCVVSESPFDAEEMKSIPTASYELPDGTTLEMGAERFKLPECNFNPSLYSTFEDAPALKELPLWATPPDNGAAGKGPRSLPDMCLDAISLCDADVRRDMFANILLVGGGACARGFRERFEKAMGSHAPPGIKLRVVSPASGAERRHASWMGGSILASLGSFQQMWMSKAEYDEHGANLIDRKCP